LKLRLALFEFLGLEEKSTVVWKALGRAALMAREATPVPMAARAPTRF
jgi:hypothetical protein